MPHEQAERVVPKQGRFLEKPNLTICRGLNDRGVEQGVGVIRHQQKCAPGEFRTDPFHPIEGADADPREPPNPGVRTRPRDP